MSTTRVSLADLAAQPHEYSPEEIAFRNKATDEALHEGAVADPDAQPWTDKMLRHGQAVRRARLANSAPEAPDLSLENADMSSDLPTWVITDENGQTIHLQAANVRRASPGAISSAVKIVPTFARATAAGSQPTRRGEPG